MVKSSNMVYKILAVGVIVIFIGVGFQPAFAVAPNTSDRKEDCSICPKVSNQNLVRLKSLLNRLEDYNYILSILSRNHPNVAEKYPELSNKIFTLKQLSQEIKQILILKNNDLICSFLFIIGVIAAFFWITNYQIMDVVLFIIDIEKHPFIGILFYFNYLFWGSILLTVVGIMVDLECYPIPYHPAIIFPNNSKL